jgi:hypothetical protein
MLGTVLLVGGVFAIAILRWRAAGWAGVVAGLLVLAFALHRQGVWGIRNRK